MRAPFGDLMGAHELFTEAWAAAYQAALNQNEAYQQAGEDWVDPVALVVRADKEHGIHAPRAVVLELSHGSCQDARAVDASAAHAAARYVISGSRGAWFEVLDGELNPLKALMFGKLKLKKGKLRELVPYTRAAQEMVQSAQEVPTKR